MMLRRLFVLRPRHPRPAEIPLAAQDARTADRLLGPCPDVAAAAFDDLHDDPLFALPSGNQNRTSTFTAAPPRRAVSNASCTLSRGKRCVTSFSGCTFPFRRRS